MEGLQQGRMLGHQFGEYVEVFGRPLIADAEEDVGLGRDQRQRRGLSNWRPTATATCGGDDEETTTTATARRTTTTRCGDGGDGNQQCDDGGAATLRAAAA